MLKLQHQWPKVDHIARTYNGLQHARKDCLFFCLCWCRLPCGVFREGDRLRDRSRGRWAESGSYFCLHHTITSPLPLVISSHCHCYGAVQGSKKW